MKVAIVLGGTTDHIDLIAELRKRGYKIVLIDYYENPPAKQVADIFFKESILNKEKVLAITKKYNANLIITACIDQALPVACYVAEKLNLPKPFSYKTSINTTNKAYMKSLMIKLGIPTSRFIVYKKNSHFNLAKLKLPLVIKPVNRNGSFGVRIVHTQLELNNYLNHSIYAKDTFSIIEEFNKGFEYSVDAYINHTSNAKILMISKIIKKNIGKNIKLITQIITPTNLSLEVISKISTICNQIAVGFNLKNTPLILQIVINDNNINVIEFAPRIGGGSKHIVIKLVTGINILDKLISSFLNSPRQLLNINTNNYYYSLNFIYTVKGIFKAIKIKKRLIEDAVIEKIMLYKTPGMAIDNNYASRDRVGSFLIKGQTIKELKNKVTITRNSLKVIDNNLLALNVL